MATKYLALLTNIGAAKLAKATALGTKVEITQLAVGDGNGVLPTPNPAQTALVHELRRAPLNMLTVDPANASQIIAEQVIPEDVGGWWIREIGLFDKDGDMVAIANCAETYKPQLQEGSGRVQVIRVILIVSSTEAVTLKIDPAVVLATRQYVDSQLRAHEQSRNHPDASTTEKGFVQLSSSVTSDSESQAATSKAVKIAMDNGSARLAKDRNLSDLPNTALARQNLELGDSSTRNVGTTAGTVASGDDARITGAMQKNQNGADIPDVAKFLQNLGLGDATKAVIHTGKVIADLNAPPKNSTGFAYQDAQNSPGFNATVLTVDSIEGSYDIQIAIGYNPLKFAFRAYSGDAKVWLNWVVLGNAAAKNTGTTAGTVAAGDDSRITGAIQRNAMVGAVSQTGGAPTGAIIERGSNSNGEYIKFADGTLICWFTRTVESITSNPSGGTTNLYFSSEVGLTFPATFVGTTPTVTPSASLSSGGTSSWPSVRGRSLTGTSLALISNVQNAAAYLGYTAIGRWF
ncbi:phage tail protein [Citrobacter freundii]|uniref:phage tail protein n=1 Tax=Citrobacter freundii TaxID=546 RepID=UPI003B22E210